MVGDKFKGESVSLDKKSMNKGKYKGNFFSKS